MNDVFRVGDMVCIRDTYYITSLIGLIGEIKIVSDGGSIGCFFPDMRAHRQGHDLRGIIEDTYGGWWLDSHNLKKLTRDTTWPPKVSRKSRYRGMNLEIVS